MKHNDTDDLFMPRERRSGIDRRQFCYDVYIPERRLGCDRRRIGTVSRVEDPTAPDETAFEAGELPAAEAFEEKVRV